MICTYFTELSLHSKEITITDDEYRHLKAFRVKIDHPLLVTNGKGLVASAIVTDYNKLSIHLVIQEFLPDYGELKINTAIAMPLLDNKDRFEFALEKVTEMGVNEVYPVISRFTQKKEINLPRLKSKSIATIKQCYRSRLTVIHRPLFLKDLIRLSNNFDRVYYADMDTHKKVNHARDESLLYIIAPEGGFSKEEIAEISSITNSVPLHLGRRILRSETAAVVGFGLLTNSIF